MRVLQAFAAFLDCASSFKLLLTKYSDFGCGFFTFWCFSKLCNVLVLFFMLFLGFKALQINGNRKYRKGLSLNCSNGDQFDGVNNLSFKPGTTKMSRVSGEGGGNENLEEEIDDAMTSNYGFGKEKCDHVVRDDSVEEELEGCCYVDQVFDVLSLRKMVKVQRQRAIDAECELEKERMAASSAADEAMAMILRFQNDKSSLQMQLNQLQRLAEEKELHDESVIESLEWIIMQHEYERSLLEEQLTIWREKLRLYLKDEELDQFDSVCTNPSVSPSSCGESEFDNMLISSLELESSPM